MRVLVDTSVWSLALRRVRPAPSLIVQELAELIQEGRVVVIGPIRQELLSGLKGNQQFQVLRDHLRAFPDLKLATADFEEAAHFFNRCRSKGIQGSNTDFLICAVASRLDLAIFTTDDD
nr:PIN domain-containing protein [Gemmatimonadota bacterium]